MHVAGLRIGSLASIWIASAPYFGLASVALGAVAPAAPPPESRPVLVVDAGAHTAPIRQAAVDSAQSTLVTVADDKTARVFELSTGRLLATLRPPVGPDQIGRLYGAAIS